MKVIVVGGGPAGLYLALLLRSASRAIDVTVIDKLLPRECPGFGVVLSRSTIDGLAETDAISHAAIESALSRWDDIDVHIGGEHIRSSGHGFGGIARVRMLAILRARCDSLGVHLRLGAQVHDFAALSQAADVLVGADGVASAVRRAFGRTFAPRIRHGDNRFVWLGTDLPLPAFSFFFKPTQHGLFWAHAYRYAPHAATFIAECQSHTWRRAGLAKATESDSIGLLQTIFAGELRGHRLYGNRSGWRRFPTITNRRWHHRNVVLIGDAAHTAHFSIGAGTRLAMGDAVRLRDALVSEHDVESALSFYEATRKPRVEITQRKAAVSEAWFEDAERHLLLPPEQAAKSLLSRSEAAATPV